MNALLAIKLNFFHSTIARMSEIVEVDSSGRIYLPAKIRRVLPWRRFLLRVEGDLIILIPFKPAIEKYYGIAGPAAYSSPEEIDEAVKHETQRILSEDIR